MNSGILKRGATLTIALLFAILFVVPSEALAAVTLKSGSRGSAVKNLEIRLYSLGYLAKKKVDGKYDSTTTKAVKYYQVTAGIQPTGVADTKTQSSIKSKKAPKKVKYTALKKGSNNSKVKKMEKRLCELGYLKSSCVDNKYTDETVTAVKSFQKAMGLSGTGKADVVTLMYMFSSLAKKNTSASTTATPTPEPTVTPTPAPTTYKTLTYGQKSTAVKNMQTRLKSLGYVSSGTPNGKYDTKTAKAVQLFQKSADLTINAKKATNEMQQVLYADTAPCYNGSSGTPTEQPGTPVKPQIKTVVNASWYGKDRAKYYDSSCGILKVGAVATITDIDTGVSFQIRRKGGLNHIDVETLTAYDTWQMYELYGRKWSWSRRAIYVTVGELSFAASMNGMPHDSSTIKDNDMSGHFCVHFLDSKTHGSNRVDPDHKKMAQKAAKANVAAVQKKIDAQK